MEVKRGKDKDMKKNIETTQPIPTPIAELEKRKLEIRNKKREEIEAVKKTREAELKALNKLKKAVQEKEAKEKRKRENHSKVVFSVAVINLVNQDAALKERIEKHLNQFYENSPARLAAAIEAFGIAVTKPESDEWKEEL